MFNVIRFFLSTEGLFIAKNTHVSSEGTATIHLVAVSIQWTVHYHSIAQWTAPLSTNRHSGLLHCRRLPVSRLAPLELVFIGFLRNRYPESSPLSLRKRKKPGSGGGCPGDRRLFPAAILRLYYRLACNIRQLSPAVGLQVRPAVGRCKCAMTHYHICIQFILSLLSHFIISLSVFMPSVNIYAFCQYLCLLSLSMPTPLWTRATTHNFNTYLTQGKLNWLTQD